MSEVNGLQNDAIKWREELEIQGKIYEKVVVIIK